MLDAVSLDNCRLLIQTLGHSLWQASVVAVLCWLVLLALPARKAGTRYAVTCGGLLVVVFASLLTAASVGQTSESSGAGDLTSARNSTYLTETSPPEGRSLDSGDAVTTDDDHVAHALGTPELVATTHDGHTDVVSSNTQTVAPKTSPNTAQQSTLVWPAIVAGVWGCGVLAMLFRLVRVIVGLRKLEPSKSPIDDSVLRQLREVIGELSQRMNLRWPVSLVVSDKVSVPGIVGTFWPTLLMPPAMLTGVPIEQLRIVIAHELAHARRFDFLVNLGQLLVESLLFFNPAVWWLSRQIRIEREACCDAVAVAATGSAVPVARTLLAIVDRLTESLGPGPAGNFAMAAGVQSIDGNEPGKSQTPLFDRVRRIVTPDHRPHIRVPWYTLVGVVVAYAFVSLGLYEGADATVQIVQQALSPKERVEKIEELIASKGDLARKEGVPVSNYNSDDPLPGSLFPEAVTVSGTIRTSDGGPLPVPLAIHGTFSGNGISGAELFGNLRETKSEFRFSGTTRNQKYVRGDTATLTLNVGFRRGSAAAKQFAPLAVGPFTIKSGQDLDNLELVLEPGFEGRVRVVDSANNPISNAFVSGMFHVDNVSSYARLNESRSRTSQDGIASVPTSSSRLTWTAEIRAVGFQEETFDLKLEPGKTRSVELKPARPTAVRLTSAVSGQPVVDANAFVLAKHVSRNGRSRGLIMRDPREENPQDYESKFAGLYRYGPSDKDGMLRLDSLADDTRYDILVKAPGFGPMILNEIEPGAGPIDLAIHPELSVSGQIIGDLSNLRTRGVSKQPYIQYRNPDRRSILDADVEVRDGKGYFDIKHLAKGDLWIQLPDRTIARELTESIDDLIIDLSQPPSHELRSPSQVRVEANPKQPLQAPTRKVILRLTGVLPSVMPKGQIRAGFVPRNKPGAYDSKNYEISNHQVEFDVEVPTKIHWMGKDFVGYSVVRESEVEVGVGDEPFRADVNLLPAGAVRGEVRLADGSLARRFQTYVLQTKQINGFNNKEARIDGSDPPGEFLLAGLPLGHEYQALVIDERRGSVASILTEPFRLDEANPIADLRFQFDEGREHVIQLVDQDGNPAVGAKAGGWFYPNNRFSRSGGFHADDEGRIVIRHISDSIPGRMELHVKYAAGFVGHISKIDWNDLPETVVLSRGVSVSGRLVDVETGRGIANASFHVYPLPPDKASSKQAIFAKTDEAGNFSFDSLEPINYQLHLYGGVPPRVPLVKNRLGVVEPDYSNIPDGTFPEWFVQGGKKEQQIIKVKIVPKRGLKLSPAGNDEN